MVALLVPQSQAESVLWQTKGIFIGKTYWLKAIVAIENEEGLPF